MKIVINKCFGGFSLSPKAVQKLAERKGRPCHFFKHGMKDGRLNMDVYVSISLEQAASEFFFVAFDVPNPNELFSRTKDWHGLSDDEKRAQNELYRQHELPSRPEARDDADLIAVVEELGATANGAHAELAVVDIPDGVPWEIDEYDGVETIHEVHRSWA